MFAWLKIKAKPEWLLFAGTLLLITLFVGCGGDTGARGLAGPEGPAGPPGEDAGGGDEGETPTLNREEDLPGVDIEIQDVEIVEAAEANARSSDGRPRAVPESGDFLAVTFTVQEDDGSNIDLANFDDISIIVSGPTTNYQRVFPRQRDEFFLQDVAERATRNNDGSWTYVFEDPIPTTYAPPIFDTTKFTDGELAGQELIAGTYTVGMRMVRNFDVEGEIVANVGNAVKDFTLGNVAGETTREVVKIDNCNQCHVTLRVHELGKFNINAPNGTFRNTKMCVLCHTAGAEDINSTAANDATNVTTEFKVLIHKIHNGAHLPSVWGVSTDVNGNRDYTNVDPNLQPDPFEIGGTEDDRADFSEVFFPVWPNLSHEMPRDVGYSALTATQRTAEQNIRRGTTKCSMCHGDPDGAGPLTAPSQGNLSVTQLSRRACGSCHDDWIPTRPYISNGQAMPAQLDDDACGLCHVNSGNTLDVVTAHVHPLEDSDLNLNGTNFNVTDLADDEGGSDADGTVDPGEKITVTFTIKDDSGNDIALNASATVITGVFTGMSYAISGPTNNYNIIYYNANMLSVLDPATRTAGPDSTFTINLPEVVYYDLIGTATGGADVFNTSRTPIVIGNPAFLTPKFVLERTATAGGDSTLSEAAIAQQNFVDVVSTANFAAGDAAVIEDGVVGQEEYVRIQNIIGNRLFFGSLYQNTSQISNIATAYPPYMKFDHAAGATIKEVTLTNKTITTAWSVTNPATGEITLVANPGDADAAKFRAGNKVIATYTTDFVMPEKYPSAINNSTNFDETWGKWTGKDIVDGTYTLGLWGGRRVYVTPLRTVDNSNPAPAATADSVSYTVTSPAEDNDFLVGAADTLEPYDKIGSSVAGDECRACHVEPRFHGGSRLGFGTCILCHGTAGSEDWPTYRTAGVSAANLPIPETGDVTINFRTMLHKIHKGEELAKADEYIVLGNGASRNGFEEIKFPALPGRAKHCDKCHGTSDAWKSPIERDHPDGQTLATRSWRATCGACHDSDAAQAHIDAQTATQTTGRESCTVCHDEGRIEPVEIIHKNR